MRRPLVVLAIVSYIGISLLRRRRPHRLAGKNVVITGGGRGLGLQLAREAAARGARIGICARNADELELAKDELASVGTFCATAVVDLRDGASAIAAFSDLRAQFGGEIDALFNVAGVIGVGPIESLTIEDFENSMATNFFGAVRATAAVLPAMRARNDGSIVNITSLGGRIAIPHMLPYCTSKFAFYAFSTGLHSEVARDRVRVTTIIPGLMRTGSPPQATFTGQPEKEYAMFAASDATPLTSISVEGAAQQIVDACERGRERHIITWQARFALFFEGLAPWLVNRVMTASGYVLPSGGEEPERKTGAESESAFTQSPLFAMSHEATKLQHEDVHPA